MQALVFLLFDNCFRSLAYHLGEQCRILLDLDHVQSTKLILISVWIKLGEFFETAPSKIPSVRGTRRIVVQIVLLHLGHQQ
jgi:hypothetical protein